jgi:hypothetical protein
VSRAIKETTKPKTAKLLLEAGGNPKELADQQSVVYRTIEQLDGQREEESKENIPEGEPVTNKRV